MSKVMFEVSFRSRVLKPIAGVTKTKKIQNIVSWYNLTKSERFSKKNPDTFKQELTINDFVLV